MPEPCFVSLNGLPDYNTATVEGDTRRIWATIEQGDPYGGRARAEPDKLALKVRDGEGNVTEPALTQDEDINGKVKGRYYADLTFGSPNTWAVRVEATGALQGVAEATFHVGLSRFA